MYHVYLQFFMRCPKMKIVGIKSHTFSWFHLEQTFRIWNRSTETASHSSCAWKYKHYLPHPHSNNSSYACNSRISNRLRNIWNFPGENNYICPKIQVDFLLKTQIQTQHFAKINIDTYACWLLSSPIFSTMVHSFKTSLRTDQDFPWTNIIFFIKFRKIKRWNTRSQKGSLERTKHNRTRDIITFVHKDN